MVAREGPLAAAVDRSRPSLPKRPRVSDVFAVAGMWESDEAVVHARDSALEGIVAGVSQLPGFVAGYWADSLDDPTRSHTFIVFAEREQADAFAGRVRGNAEGQASVGIRALSLEVVAVQASA